MSYLSKRMKQIVGLNPKKKTNEFELSPLIESTDEKLEPMISRCPTKFIKESGRQDYHETKDSGEASSQPIRSSRGTSDHKTAEPRGGKAVKKLGDLHPRFGPLYSVDQPSIQAMKEKAWEHVLTNSPENNQLVTTETYLQEIRKVESEAKKVYGDKVSGIGSGFRWMMIKDGCFFLQLAFLILGYYDQLGYPAIDPIFGIKQNKKDMKMWVDAMFFVGNQIPLVVLDELMKQGFFQNVINKVTLDPPPSGLCNKVLFDLLVLPAEKRKQKMNIEPCDLLHGLQNLMLGLHPLGNHFDDQHKQDDDDNDLEANEEDEGILTSATGDEEDDNGTSSPFDKLRKCLTEIGFSSVMDNRKRIFPSATELEREGISIEKLKNGGVRRIDFKRSYYFWASLYLPVFPVDEKAEMIFQNLITYEMINQQGGTSKREASSYLRFMSDLIQTTKDVSLLHREGIIEGNSNFADKLPGILSRLVSSEDIRLTQELHILKRKISDYSNPWIHYKILAVFVAFLTLLQTFFALLAYFKPSS